MAMTKRIAVYLADGIAEYLEEWAGKEKRAVSNLASFLLEASVREKMDKESSDSQPPSNKPKAS